MVADPLRVASVRVMWVASVAVSYTHLKHDGAGCAYCRKSSHANPSSHDGGIDDEVHLLKDVTQDKRNRKFDDG